MMQQLFHHISHDNTEHNEENLRRNIIRHEARVGGTIFGPPPAGIHREFFCLDEYTWIWYEEWSEKGHRRSRTVRYAIRNNQVLKAQDGQTYRLAGRDEAERLLHAAKTYQKKVDQEVYQPILREV